METLHSGPERPRATPVEITSSAEVIAIIEGGKERPYRGWLVAKIKEGKGILRHKNGRDSTDLEAPTGVFVMPPEKNADKRITKLVQVSISSKKPELVLMDRPENPESTE